MTSLNRSNDAIWGMVSGANVVHLSMFHEYVARALGRPMGGWWHFSNNFHIYTENPKWRLVRDIGVDDVYEHQAGFQTLVPLFTTPNQQDTFDREVRWFIQDCVKQYRVGGMVARLDYSLQFIRDAAVLFNVWQVHKAKQAPFDGLHLMLENVMADDWRWAATAWLARRYLNRGQS